MSKSLYWKVVSFEYILGSSDKEEARVKPPQRELNSLALSKGVEIHKDMFSTNRR